ncbi:aldehyde dehydrogenase family protein [Spirosoma spitsbergense]|uniref:aldehyde dehydrogenase family protein n=1 Tax=Spirosoma spitsbergense TaxID=431554 RepID=UPI000378CABF|nr:aldehyde dehydrogenase family protein [Spirosoma spitsbergense]
MTPYTELNRQFINGKWIDGSTTAEMQNLNPFTGKVIHELPSASTADVDTAFVAAKQACGSWAVTNPLVRRDLLLNAARIISERQEEFIDWLAKEAGSTYIKGVIEVQQAHDILIEAASFPTRMHGRTMASTIDGKESYVYRKPLGVVSLISPWNFPLYLSMRTIAPALAVGNTMVVKPSAESLVTGGTIIAKLLEEAGFPTGVFNVVVGKSDLIGDYFTGHPISKMVSFTGSTSVGRGIGRIAGENAKKSALELGGNNAFIVLDDADVDQAVAGAIFGRFLHQGQVCMATNRILIHQSIYEEFKTKFVAHARQLPYGDPTDKQTIIGPLIDNKAILRIQSMIDESIKQGAVVETGNLVQGNVLQPTVLSGMTIDMPIFKDEIFGPAVGIMSFATDEEAIALANATDYGLSGALHTRDVYRGMKLARTVETGMIHINDQSDNDEVHAPFGGEKLSGTGRFGGDFILEEMTTVQWVSVAHEPRQYPF